MKPVRIRKPHYIVRTEQTYMRRYAQYCRIQVNPRISAVHVRRAGHKATTQRDERGGVTVLH